MTAIVRPAAATIFCEAIREEKGGSDTLIGVWPDNVAIPASPVSLPRLSIYTRITVPLDEPFRSITLHLQYPWDDPPLVVSVLPPEGMTKAVEDSKQQGAPFLTLIGRISSAPFNIKAAGRLQTIVQFDSLKLLAGHLNFKIGD